MITETCLAPVRWIERGERYPGSSGSSVLVVTMSKVLQQQWELVTTENGTWMSTTHEWRDVPTATDDLSNTPK